MADAQFKFGVDTSEGRKDVSSFAALVDDVADRLEKGVEIDVDTSAAENKVKGLRDEYGRFKKTTETPVAPEVDTKPAESKLDRLADLAKNALKFEAIGSAGEFLQGIEERGAAAADAVKALRAQTGLTGAEFEALESSAVSAFRNGVGESVAEAMAIMGKAQQTLGQFLDPPGLEAFTTRMAGVQKALGTETSESIEKSRSAIAAWGLQGAEAGDLVSLGLQKAVTPSNDFLDTLAEYSPLMKEAGFTAGEFTGTLIKGAEAGAFSLDKVADAAKEAQIRLKAGDISSALKDISSPITDSIAAIVKAGEQGKLSTKEVMQQSAAAIEEAFDAGKISDTVRSKLQVAIAGTPAEDLGADMYARIFSAPIDTETIAAQAQLAGEQMTAAVGSQNIFQGLLRDAAALGESAAASLQPLIAGAGTAATSVSQLAPAVSLVTANMDKFKGMASSIGSGMGSFLTNPITIAVGAVVGLGFAVEYLTDTRLEELEASLAAGEAQLKSVEIQKQQLAATIKQTEATPDLAREYEKLATKTNLSAAEQKRLTDVSLTLNRTYPGLIKSGGDYADSLEAVKKQAAQTKDRVADMRDQMEELHKQSQRIAEANRRIQAEILQEQIVTKLFTSQSGVIGQLDVFFNNIIGETSSGVEALNKKMSAFFKGLLDAQTEQEVVKRIGDLQLTILNSVQAGKISKENQQELEGMLTQLSTVLSARFRAAQEEAKGHGRKVGTNTGTGVVEGIEKTLLTNLSGADGVLGEAFEAKLWGRLSAILTAGTEILVEEGGEIRTKILLGQLDEEALYSQKLANELERIDETFKGKRKQFEEQLYEIDPKTGARREKQLTDDVKKQLRTVLAELERQEAQIRTETENSYNRILADIRGRAIATGGVVVPIRAVIDTKSLRTPDALAELNAVQAELDRLLAERASLEAQLALTPSSFVLPELITGTDDQIAAARRRIAELKGETTGFMSTLETQLLAGEGLWRSFFDSIDTGRIDELRREVSRLRSEESELALSLARRGRMTEEEARQRIKIAEERATKERELERETADLGVIALRGSLRTLAGLHDGFAKTIDEQLTIAKDGEADMEKLLGSAAGKAVAITAEAAMANQDIVVAAVNATIDTSLQLLLANQAQYLFDIFGASIKDLGVVGGPIAFVALAAALGSLGALAKSALENARPERRFMGGPIEGGTQYLVNDDPLQRTEWVVDASSTAANRGLLEMLRQNPGMDLRSWVGAVAREAASVEARERMRVEAAQAARAALDMSQLTKQVESMRSDIATQTHVMRGGVAIEGEARVTHGHIRQSFHRAARRAGALQ